MEKTKTCTKCGTEKMLSEFGKNRHAKDGLNHICKDCACAHSAAYRKANHEKVIGSLALWRKKNKEKVKAYAATYNPKYYTENRTRVLAVNAVWRKANLEKMQAYSATYYAENIDRAKANMTAWRATNWKARHCARRRTLA